MLSEQDILAKEQELTHKIQQYYNFDLSALKNEIQTVLADETGKIDRERQKKLQEIQSKFAEIEQLADSHLHRGDRYVTLPDAQQMDDQLLQEFAEKGDSFEEAVREANQQKQGLREEIIGLETEMRQMRDALADKQKYNDNMRFILQKEESLNESKSVIEEQALQLLQGDLQMQLGDLEQQSERIGAKITPHIMETLLTQKVKERTDDYDQFVADGEADLVETQ